MVEIFKPVEGYENYQVSNYGRVKRFYKTKPPRILKPRINRGGYLSVHLVKDGKQKNFLVHRLTAEAFIPNSEGKPFINHRDGNKFNNHIGNLEWCTQKENIRHAVNNGLQKVLKGEEHGRAKLTADQARFIRGNPDGLTGRQLAKLFGITPTAISLIQRGVNWKCVKSSG